MIFDPEKHHRRSIRLKGYNYAQPGYYFITICSQNRNCLFGEMNDAKMQLNSVGKMVEIRWYELKGKFKDIELGTHIIMPNHIHGILIIKKNERNVGANQCVRPDKENKNILIGQTHRSAPTLGRIIQWFKTMTTNEYIRGIKQNRWKPSENNLWQRNYYEHIIRNDAEFKQIQQYIQDNPSKWHEDTNNPVNLKQ